MYPMDDDRKISCKGRLPGRRGFTSSLGFRWPISWAAELRQLACALTEGTAAAFTGPHAAGQAVAEAAENSTAEQVTKEGPHVKKPQHQQHPQTSQE